MIAKIAALLLGGILTVFGLYFLFIRLFFYKSFVEITESEIEMMKKDGKFKGEPNYMKEFRVARSEYDLEEIKKTRIRSLFLPFVPIVAGIMIVFIAFFCL